MRARRDADRPRRARRKGTGGDLRLARDITDGRLRAWRHRNVDYHLPFEIAVAVEHLNAMVAAIGDINVAVIVGRDRMRRVELTGPVAAIAPGLEPFAVLVGLGDPRIDVAVADIGVVGGVEGDVGDLPE